MAWARWMVLPRVELRRAELVLLRRVPADGCGIEQHFGALQRREPRAFGIPLVPADERADAAGGCVDCLKAEIAGREVILLVIKRIVGDVHLAVDAGDLAVGVKRDGSVVVKAGCSALKERGNDGSVGLAGNLGEFGGGDGPGMGSARSKRRRSSRWQKYCVRKSSGRQTTCAPEVDRRSGAGDVEDGFHWATAR
jgi:hypothetical protein